MEKVEKLSKTIIDYSINVKKDEIIRKGYQIGNVGSTGAVTGPHLHFEIRKNGIATNPFDFIKK